MTSESDAKQSTTPDHLEAIRALPTLIKNAKLRETRPDRKQGPNIAEIQRFFAPITIMGNQHNVKLTVKKYVREGSGAYTYSLEKMEVPTLKLETASAVRNMGGMDTSLPATDS